MFSSAFHAGNYNRGLTNGVTSPGSSVTSAIPKYTDTTGTTLISSMVLIDSDNNILMAQPTPSGICFTTLGSVGSAVDPTFCLGNVQNIGGEASLTLDYEKNGSPRETKLHITEDTIETIQELNLNSGGNTSIRLDPSTARTCFSDPLGALFTSSIGFSSSEVLSIAVGPNKASLDDVVSISSEFLKLESSLTLNLPELPAVPATPPAGEVLLYPRGGEFYFIDSSGIEQSLRNQPFVSSVVGYFRKQNNGYLRDTNGSFTNKVPYVVPFDAYISFVTAICEEAVNGWQVEIYKNTDLAPTYTLPVSALSLSAVSPALALPLDAEDELSVYLRKGTGGSGTGNNIPTPKVEVFMTRRI